MQTVKAIILKSLPYSEQQQIMHVYSAERGYMQLITPMALFKRKNNHTVQCMQIVEIEYFPNERGRLHKLKSASSLVNTSSVYFDGFKMNIALLWGEILDLVLRHSDPNEDVFEYIRYSVEYLNTSREDIANFNLLFLFRLSRIMGFGIDTDTYRPDYVFNINDGCFYPTGAPENYYTGPHSARIIRELCVCPLESLKDIPLNQQSRKILLDIALLFLGFHLNLDFNTKSIRVIREIFS